MPTYLEKSVVLATSPHRDFWSRDIIRTTRSMPEIIAKSVLDTPQYGSIAFTIHHTVTSKFREIKFQEQKVPGLK